MCRCKCVYACVSTQTFFREVGTTTPRENKCTFVSRWWTLNSTFLSKEPGALGQMVDLEFVQKKHKMSLKFYFNYKKM